MLDPLYRLLGVIASVNARFRQIRINAIPANVALFIVLGIGAYAGFEQYVEARRNGLHPTVQPLGDLLTRVEDPDHQFVSLEGLLEITPLFEDGSKRWAPLLDAQSGRALLVELSPERTLSPQTAPVVVTGMLRTMDARLRGEIAHGILRHYPKPIDQRLLLVEGDVPAAANLALALGIASAVLLLLFAVATMKRDVIFVPVSTSELPLPPTDDVALFISGKLRFDENTAQHVISAPAIVGRWPSGDVAIGEGPWALVMRPGSVTEVQPGYQYFGVTRRRAVRFRFVSAMDGGTEQAVLAASSGDPRSMLQG